MAGTNNEVIGTPKNIQILEMPEVLKGYREKGFESRIRIPVKSPLGGECLEYTNITSDFYNMRNVNTPKEHMHQALDIVPTKSYYSNNQAYRLTNGDIILFATIDGEVIFSDDSDKAAGLNVRIINDNGDLEVGYAHLKTSFVRTGDYVQAGIPIGVMGTTGTASTGVHVHYWVAEILYEGSWPEPVDPLPYILSACN